MSSAPNRSTQRCSMAPVSGCQISRASMPFRVARSSADRGSEPGFMVLTLAPPGRADITVDVRSVIVLDLASNCLLAGR